MTTEPTSILLLREAIKDVEDELERENVEIQLLKGKITLSQQHRDECMGKIRDIEAAIEEIQQARRKRMEERYQL